MTENRTPATQPKQPQKPQQQIMEVLKQTPQNKITDLDFVKERFIKNYNEAHGNKKGDLAYHRQMVHFNQIISASDKLKAADQFSLYACFITAAVNGDSLDPSDEETYLVPKGGKAYLWPQVKSRVKRLRNSGQVLFADQPKLVYENDDFQVENGRVVKHTEKFLSEKIVAGYVRFVLDEKGNDKYFIFRKSDWEAWRKKSLMPDGDNWKSANDQPLPAFLRTKLMIHACKDSSWSSQRTLNSIERYPGVEIEDPAEVRTQETTAEDVTNKKEADVYSAPAAEAPAAPATVTYNDDDNY